MNLNIRNVPKFLRDNGQAVLAMSVEKRIGNREDNGREDRMDSEVLMGYLIQDNLGPPSPQDHLVSPDFAYLQNLAVIIQGLQDAQIEIDLSSDDILDSNS